MLSTASLDKSPQSQQRGITLDLGFSAFLMPLPPALADRHELANKYDMVQITLVDCPGHASLIKTIIGGAQIIDMVLLVVDATKGIQTQTAECLVIAEITTSNLIMVLNKVDLFPIDQRQDAIRLLEKKIRGALRHTRFSQAPMVPVSACVGGGAASVDATSINQTMGVSELLQLLNTFMRPPDRTNINNHSFYFAIDHCFPVKGQGTVITGTCLAGSIRVNEMIEFPALALQRKIKSIQMFHRKVKEIQQGDRAGICMSNLDPQLLERGIAAYPNSVPVLDSAIAIVRQVRYYKGSLTSKTKFHMSVGHATVMGTVTFFGAREIAQKNLSPHILDPNSQNYVQESFDFEQSYIQQDEYLARLDPDENDPSNELVLGQENSLEKASLTPKESLPLHYALVEFQSPVFCPLHSLIIGSKLDTDIQANTCRLAFSGRLIQKVENHLLTQVKFYTTKEKCGLISRIGEPFQLADGTVVRFDIYGSDLFKKETDMNLFIGLKVVTSLGDVGVIQNSYGTSGQFKVFFPAGTTAKEGDKLILAYKRYVHDTNKTIHQDIVLPPPRVGTRIVQEDNSEKKVVKKTNSKKMEKKPIAASSDRPVAMNAKPQESKLLLESIIGEICTIKDDALVNGLPTTVIVSGLFTPEIDIRQFMGEKVQIVGASDDQGNIAGPFGKAGKCKVVFPKGVSCSVGTKVKRVADGMKT
jgi:selenocysteine-specific elongation factor